MQDCYKQVHLFLVRFLQKNIFQSVLSINNNLKIVLFSLFLNFGFEINLSGKDDLILDCDGKITYDDDIQTFTAKDNASLKGKGFLLLAHEIRFSKRTGEISAKGRVSITKNNFRLLADELWLSTANGNFFAYNAVGGSPPIVFRAESVERNTLIDKFSDVEFFFSDYGKNVPNLKTKEYFSDQNSGRFKISKTELKLDDSIIGIIPGFQGKSEFFSRKLKSKTKLGKDNRLGWFVQTGFNYSRQFINTETYLSFYQERGLLFSPKFYFKKQFEDGYILSSISGGYIQDRGKNIGNDLRNLKINKNRAFTKFNQTMRLDERWRIATSSDWESDSEIIRDFDTSGFYKNQWNENHSEITYEGDGYSVSVFSKWQMHRHESMQEYLPYVGLESGPSEKWGLYHSSTLNYARLAFRNMYGDSVSSSTRMNIGHKIEKPFSIHKGINLNPSFAFRHQTVQTLESNSNRAFGEYGLDLYTNLYSYLPLKYSSWEIDEVLHLTKFSLEMRKTKRLLENSGFLLPQIISPPEDLNLGAIDLLDFRNDNLIERNLVRIGWENNFIGKWNEDNRKLLSSRIYYDLWSSYSDNNDDRRFLYIDLSLKPAAWFAITHKQKVDIKSEKSFLNSIGLELRDGRFQGLSLNLVSYLELNKQLHFSAWKRLNENIITSTNGLYDLKSTRLECWQGTLQFRQAGSWHWNLSMISRSGSRKENHMEWSIGVSFEDFDL